MNTTLLNNLLKFSSSSIAYFNLKKKKNGKNQPIIVNQSEVSG